MAQYADVFNAVEGNTTFYALQSPATIRKWCDEAPAHLRFCFKFHKDISHRRRLVGAEAATRDFFALLAPFGERLGPFFLQLDDKFGPKDLPACKPTSGSCPENFATSSKCGTRRFSTAERRSGRWTSCSASLAWSG